MLTTIFVTSIALAATATLDGAVGMPPASETTRCSLSPFRVGRSDLYLVGTALSDTLFAGPGEVVPSGQPGHWGSGERREVYGQLVRVELLNPDAPVELREALDHADPPNVLMVPWDYDPSCATTYWTRSARWIEPGLEGFYIARLRPRTLWVEGRPTFDAFLADLAVYPHGSFFVAGYRGTRERLSLTAREYFSLHSALPTAGETRESVSKALDRVRAWEAENPDLTGRYPADETLARVKGHLGAGG